MVFLLSVFLRALCPAGRYASTTQTVYILTEEKDRAFTGICVSGGGFYTEPEKESFQVFSFYGIYKRM